MNDARREGGVAERQREMREGRAREKGSEAEDCRSGHEYDTCVLGGPKSTARKQSRER